MSSPQCASASSSKSSGREVRLAIVATTALTLRSFLTPYARYFRERGWRVHGIAAGAEDCASCREAFDHVHNIAWSRNPANLPACVAGYRSVRALARQWRFDLVHVHTPIAAFIGRLALRKLRPDLRVIYTAHGFHSHAGGGMLANALFRTLERCAGRWTDRLVVINEDDARAALSERIVTHERLRVMPGIGIDLRRFDASALPVDVSGPFPDGAGGSVAGPVFLMVAELHPRKRHRDAVAALALLERRDVHLAFAGSGPEQECVRRLAQELGIEERVHFLGYRRDVLQLLQLARGLIQCSAREGLPMSVMEAMAVGTPVIGTRIRGIRDLLAEDAGLLVEVGDAAGIAAAMNTVMNEPCQVARMAANARARVASYSLDQLLSLHESMYEELLRDCRA